MLTRQAKLNLLLKLWNEQNILSIAPQFNIEKKRFPYVLIGIAIINERATEQAYQSILHS